MAIRFNNMKRFITETPTEKELNAFSINELITIARSQRSIKHPLKKYLINYILLLGQLK